MGERERFEQWYEADAMPLEADWFKKDGDGDYEHDDTASCWRAWQAAVAAERERYAKTANVLMGDAIQAFCDNPKDMLKQLEVVFDFTVARAVAAERERCERIIGGLMYESYDISGPECLSRALIAIRKGELESERAVDYREGCQAAVAAERERCIKVIENLMYENEWGNVLFDEIEAAIRKSE